MDSSMEQLAPVISLGIFMFIILAVLSILVISILLWCKIFSKTGYILRRRNQMPVKAPKPLCIFCWILWHG